MTARRVALAVVLLLPPAAAGGAQTPPVRLASPDGRLVATIRLVDVAAAGVPAGGLVYRVTYEGRTVVADSALGLELADGPLDGDFDIVGRAESEADATWRPVCGERSVIRDHYRQTQIELVQRCGGRHLRLTFRAYDEGIAFCYTVPEQAGLKNVAIVREATSFAFAGDHPTWPVYAAQGNYAAGAVPLSRLKPGVERPLVVRVADDLYAAVTEARLVDYARMKFRQAPGRPTTLEALLDVDRGETTAVVAAAPLRSPWRVIAVARRPGVLLENNFLIQNLNDPCALADTSWIKPGKIIREATLTTVGGKACVDFCLARGLQYIEYDAGWYGHEYDDRADARRVDLDPKRNPVPGSLDLQAVIDYAGQRGIGVILYVNRRALERQIDELLPLYRRWGVRGVKYGFVNVGPQRWTAWLHEAIRKAAEHRLMVDIHDEYRSTGYERTYPNLMTVEGILGNEGFPSPTHNATLPFTRFLTGPADYTFCWYSPRLQTTHAHQLALSTLYYSPWQFLFWYDRPSQYEGDPALDYWKRLPTCWDETRVLADQIGAFAAVARRRGDAWFVGAIRPGGGGPIELKLSFLRPGRSHQATIYRDARPDDAASNAVAIDVRRVDADSELSVAASTAGGVAVWIVPVDAAAK